MGCPAEVGRATSRRMDETPKLLVVFDVDGTLVDSAHVIVAAMSEAYVSHGLVAPTREAIVGIVGLSVAEAIEELSCDEPHHPRDAIADAFKMIFRARVQVSDPSALYPGAADVIDALWRREGVALGLATGNSRRGVERFIERYGLEGRFVTTQSADDAPSKPHPAMLRQAAAEAGVPAEAVVMIGDTTFDMEMARYAGARAIGVAWGNHPPARLFAAGAERVIASFDELYGALGLGGMQAA